MAGAGITAHSQRVGFDGRAGGGAPNRLTAARIREPFA